MAIKKSELNDSLCEGCDELLVDISQIIEIWREESSKRSH